MANFLRLKRVELGISQFALAVKTGVPQHRISQLERGVITPTEEEINSLSKALGVTPEELLKPARSTVINAYDDQQP